MAIKREIEKNKIGLEDLVTGTTSVSQNRYSGPVSITGFRSLTLPLDNTALSIGFALYGLNSISNITSIGSLLNTTYKFMGMRVFQSSGTLRPLWATGPNPGDPWVNAAGTTIYTPS